MFQDESLEPVSFGSCWQHARSCGEAGTQTSELLSYDAAVQTTEKASVAVQTDKEKEKTFKLVIDNSAELRAFMQRVEPVLSEQLTRNTESHAFDGYAVSWEEEATAVTCVHTLTEASFNYQFPCTGLDWNCTGSVLAAGFGCHDHQDWCAHKSMLCTWNLDRRVINSTKADVTIDVPSCVMCVAFHPVQPAFIAGGTFSGEVRVWSIAKEGQPLLASSSLSKLGHKEPVAKVEWILDEDDRQGNHNLLSLGTDGRVLVWRGEWGGGRGLQVVKALSLLTESVPRSLRLSKASGSTPIGGTSLAFSHEDETLFIVGSENGSVLKCSLHTASTVDDTTTDELEFPSPIKFVFHPHHGPVYGASCSPFHRNLFITCSTDASVHLYSLLDASPLLSIEPASGYLFSIAWSYSRPLVFAAGTADGRLLIFDLEESLIQPCRSLEASPHKRAVYSMQFNRKRPELLVTGDASGVVRVWRLSTALTIPGAGEVGRLDALASQPPSSSEPLL